MQLEDTIACIRRAHRKRCFTMEQRTRMDLALGSFLRLVLGWRKDLPEAERKAIANEAQRLMKEPDGSEFENMILAARAAREPFAQIEKAAKKEMAKLAKTLPVWEWAEPVRGFGAVSLAIIVAEAGDLTGYPKKGHLWKRMGLALVDGVRQGGLTKGAAKADWIAHGYNRMRRSRMWNVGGALIKGNGDGPYRQAYLARKDYERARAEASGLTVAPAAKIPKGRAVEFMSDGHIHRRAQRYMEKRLLKDLWQAWREARGLVAEGPNHTMPPAQFRDAAE